MDILMEFNFIHSKTLQIMNYLQELTYYIILSILALIINDNLKNY